MPKLIDLTGQRFGRLVVKSRAENSKSGKARWNCVCDCGRETKVKGSLLKNGKTKSCGCLRKETTRSTMLTHSMSHTLAYLSWSSMKQRCTNPNYVGYKNYGERGIAICERWDKFENFYEDMGDKPDGLMLERIDNNKGYSPENCCYATRKAQNKNKRNIRLIEYQGRIQCISDWAEELGISKQTLSYRLKHYPQQTAFNM